MAGKAGRIRCLIFNTMALLSLVMIIVVIWLWLWAYYRPKPYKGAVRFSNYRVAVGAEFETTLLGCVRMGIIAGDATAPITVKGMQPFWIKLFDYGLKIERYSWGTVIYVHVPYWLLLLVFAILPSLWLYKRIRRPSLPEHFCPKCQYDLTGTIAAGRSECPECGAAISQATQAT